MKLHTPSDANFPEAVPHFPESDGFRLADTLGMVRQSFHAHRRMILFITALTMGLVGLYIYIWPPTYQAEVMISADSDKDQQRAAFYQGWNIFRKDSLIDEATLMVSQPVLVEVIRRLDLKYHEVYHPFSSYAIHLWVNSAVGKAYRKVKNMVFPPAPSPYTITPEEKERGQVLKDFKDGVSVAQVGEASIGVLAVKASTPRAAEIANTLVQVYLEQRRQRFVNEATAAYQSLSEETAKSLAQVRGVEVEMEKFYAQHGLILTFEKERLQIVQLQELRAQVTNLNAQIADDTSQAQVIDGRLRHESANLRVDKVFAGNAANSRLTRLEIALADARQTFQPNAPEVRELEEEIRLAQPLASADGSKGVVRHMASMGESYETLQRRKWELDSRLQGNRAALGIKRTELDRLRNSMAGVPGQVQRHHDLERRRTVYEATYRSLNEKLTMATVSMATAKSAPASMRVVEYAGPVDKPRWPNTKLMIGTAALFGLVAGMLGALLYDLVFQRVNRNRLDSVRRGHQVFAAVEQDSAFVDQQFLNPAAMQGNKRPPKRNLIKTAT